MLVRLQAVRTRVWSAVEARRNQRVPNVVQLSPAAIGALAARTCRVVSSTIERRVLMDMATTEDVASPHNESR